MNHSFNVKVAEEFGIEKAILLENFYFWIIKNRANNKNLHNGKYYTYNTAEAFEKLFPYMKARKIAQLLREMEHEDGLLISGQFNNYDRTKSYTLTDLAMSYFEVAIIQNFDNGRYENATMESQKSVSCLNTDINTDVNTYSCSTQQQFKKPTIKEIQDYCSERGNKINAEYFFDYYEAKGWIVGKVKMKDWKAVIRNWEKKNPAEAPKKENNIVAVCEKCGHTFTFKDIWECPKCHCLDIIFKEKRAG